ncbi:MAG: DUF5107 domain-containing protein [Bacteroidota bacterium]
MKHHTTSKLVPLLTLCFFIITFFCTTAQKNTVKIWEEDLTLPAYQVDPPDKNPMFFENDSYQGASRMIYPYPLEDDMTNIKTTKTYKAVYLENDYLKVCVLPEVGGRLFYATDKTNDYELFYRQHVIKPAHIGMVGAWISGGIEFCVFHHHRASTNMPVDYKLESNEDGSATLWIGETEPRHRMKWTFGITLYPEKSYLELDGRMINVTPNTNSILYWANVATHVNDDYQIIFPPSTQFATFHSKNSFSHWPITKEAYRGNKYYENNIDASYWKNHPGSNSFFAHEIKEGFLAGYDHGKQAGTMLVANPHIVKGAKLWEWGKGSSWDTKVLTDEDGPYAELMSGAYSDNQPDYSWIKPYELKTFKQYWYPMRESGGATTANLDALLNLELKSEQSVFVAANTTSAFKDAKLVLANKGKTIWEKTIDIAPDQAFHNTITLTKPVSEADLKLSLQDAEGKLLIDYQKVQLDENAPLPETVKPPLAPTEIDNQEELYFTGLRIKQFYNVTIDPTSYFLEALKRDPFDTRCNTQMGIYWKERGDHEKAANYFRKAIERLTKNYTRPRNGEAFYHLGVILKQQNQLEAAYDTLYRAAWDHAFAAAAYLQLAQISTIRGAEQQALTELEIALANNASNLNALNLKASILRHMGKKQAAAEVLAKVIAKDPLNFWAYNEQALLTDDKKQLIQLMRDAPESYLELAVTYLNIGLLEEAKTVLMMAKNATNPKLAEYPTISYYLGYIAHQMGDATAAKSHFSQAASYSTDYCFPYRLESETVYLKALEYDPSDAKAYYYLGNLLYDKQPKRAIAYWEKAVERDANFAIAYRNLGWGYNQTYNDLGKAITAYEQAIANKHTDARYYLELDRLYEAQGTPVAKRHRILTENQEQVAQLNIALIRAIQVLVAAESYDQAIDLLTTKYFSRKEGGQDLHDLYVDAMLLRGRQYLANKKYNLALKDFKAADEYPENQSIGKKAISQRQAQIFYYQAMTYEHMGKQKLAKQYYQQAASIKVKDDKYNYEKALALRKTGQTSKADDLLQAMTEAGQADLNEIGEIDFFSKFGDEDSENVQQSAAHQLIGLGYLGLGKTDKAQQHFQTSLALHPANFWANSFVE